MKIDDIATWESFVAVAKACNFSKAAIALRVPLPQVSKRVAKLEDQLGVRLFQRTTRVVTLTDEGTALLPKVSSVLEDLSGIESTFENTQKITGTVRITAVPFVAHRLLIPVLSDFMQKYPGIQIELELSENIVNMVESNFDIAIRIQEPRDSDMVYRKLAPNDLVFCVSPEYLRKTAEPLTRLEHLQLHPLLMLAVHRRCRFRDSSNKLDDYSGNNSFKCENGWFMTELALRSFGVLVRSRWDVAEYIKDGKLVQVLKKHPLETFGHIYAVIPSRRYLAPRIRIFMDFLVNYATKWSCL